MSEEEQAKKKKTAVIAFVAIVILAAVVATLLLINATDSTNVPHGVEAKDPNQQQKAPHGTEEQTEEQTETNSKFNASLDLNPFTEVLVNSTPLIVLTFILGLILATVVHLSNLFK